MQNVFVELSEYMQKPIKQLVEEYQYWQEKYFPLQQKNIAEANTGSEVMEFYKNNFPYIYSLACYEVTPNQQTKFNIIRKFCAKNNIIIVEN